ncbi:cytochrome b5 [Filobasidium floriforme]|uniref:cytochrome b5 n=1 Tax=Filobasidium floriforme TaxID=5210 RepID=UPI001E8D427B|nr:cytochrome b5 [Filobasidium floriforme]KAH8090454.1 cytochrome b5 [Filobasidium floriforme]
MAFLIPSLPSWLASPGPSSPNTVLSEKMSTTPQDDVNADEDAPPQFPLPDSAQRSRASGTTETPVPTFEIEVDEPEDEEDEYDGPPTPRAGAKSLPATSVAAVPASLPLPPSTTTKPNPAIKKRQKVALAPGCSPLDWAKLKSSGKDLRGPCAAPGFGYLRVTMDELKKHNTKGDAWSAFNGKVYNMSEYARFHPGGEKEMMRVAGRDGTRLFMLTHAWVNVDFMLDNCMVGFLVPG